MCGILGHCGDIDAARFEQALQCIAHRGPDDAGQVSFSDQPGLRPVRLGHRRLSVLDLSPRGHQPMESATGRYSIAYNGEVYNHDALRSRFPGVEWRSGTDTEVVLRGFEAAGPAIFRELDGMFALAILDRQEGQLYLARDQFGIKPLYYRHSGDSLSFASEIKALRDLSNAPDTADPQALYHYFSFLYVPAPQTAYREIRQLEPGSYGVYDLRTGALRLEQFYHPGVAGAAPRSIEEAALLVRAELERSVRSQMIADVPLGSFLSGGVDSTALLGIMARASTTPVKTFTIRFEGAGSGAADESAAARLVSEFHGSEHHELEVDISQPEEMLALANHFDQPFGNPTFYLSYLVCRETRRHVTVALSGAGGDELFGGYPRYKAVPYSRAFARVPSPVARALRGIAAVWPERDGDQLRRRVKTLLDGIGMPAADQYLTWTYFFNRADKAKLLAPGFRAQVATESERLLEELLDQRDLAEAVLDLDVMTFLPNNILEYSDRTSMAVSLEVRVPYLTTNLYELARSFPASWRTGSGRPKRVLYEAVRDLIPPENRGLPKTGFCPPLTTWMDSLDLYFDRYMTRDALEEQGVLNWDHLQQLRAEQRTRRRDHSVKLFGLIMFDVWWRRHIAGGGSAGGSEFPLDLSPSLRKRTA